MIIAATYDNGEIFQHFGKSPSFKVYETDESQKIVSAEVLPTGGSGHGFIASMLSGKGVNVLICGGIGSGAVTALEDAGIEIYAGQSGSADEAVNAYLNGTLEKADPSCSHHGEGHCCHDEGGNNGKTVRVHYRGTFDDGSVFDSSYDRNEPLEFVCGAGMMIKGFDAAVAEMKLGEIRDIHLMPEDAYGPSDPNAIFTVEISRLPGAENLTAGQQVYLQDQMGRPFPVKVAAKDDKMITFDANHEMAGKELNFRIELVEIL